MHKETSNEAIERLKVYIIRTEQQIRDLGTMKRKYALENKILHSQLASSKIKIKTQVLSEANVELASLIRNERETVVFT